MTIDYLIVPLILFFIFGMIIVITYEAIKMVNKG